MVMKLYPEFEPAIQFAKTVGEIEYAKLMEIHTAWKAGAFSGTGTYYGRQPWDVDASSWPSDLKDGDMFLGEVTGITYVYVASTNTFCPVSNGGYRGEYSAHEKYIVGQLVTDTDGRLYVCIGANMQLQAGQDITGYSIGCPLDNTTYWALLSIGAGEWVDRMQETLRSELSDNLAQQKLQDRSLLKRSCAEAGLTLVDGSFEEGASVTLKTQVVWQQATGKIFGWFQDGVKTISAGTTPETTGGIGAGAWVDRTQETLRDKLTYVNGAHLAGNAAFYIDDALTANVTDIPNGAVVIAASRGGQEGGGGVFKYSSSSSLSSDGGIIFTPTIGSGRLIRQGYTVFGFNGPVNIKWFGAVGDNSTDDTTSILNTIASPSVFHVYAPVSNYVLSGTITLKTGMVFEGVGSGFNGSGSGATFCAAHGMNVPLFKFTASEELKNVTLLGSATGSTTNQHLVYITGTNGVKLENIFFNGGYHNVHIDGTSFYTTVTDCVFYDAVNAQFYCNSATSAGVDMIMSGCRFLSLNSSASFCAYFNGLGSIIAYGCQFSVNNPTGATLYFDNPATGFGGAQLFGCVFESGSTTAAPAVYVKGSFGLKWQLISFSNCNINGGKGVAIHADYCSGIYVNSGSVLSSTNALGSFYVPPYGEVTDIDFNSVDLEGSAAISPIQCGGPVTLSGSFTNVRWKGSASMIDFSAASAGNVLYLNVIGGKPGTNVTPIKLTSPATVPGHILIDAGWNSYTPTVGSTGGSITASSAVGYYRKIGRTIHWQCTVNVTTNGTGAGGLTVSLPVAPANISLVGCGREGAVAGKMLQCSAPVGSTTCSIYNYDNTYPASNGASLTLSGTYQVSA